MARKRDKLLQIEIKGFKSISSDKPLQLDFCDVTILLGANGSGKSNIISFFRMLNHMMDGTIQMIKDASVNSQVIIATQSPQLIDGFSLDSIVVLEQDDEKKSTIAHKLDEIRLKEWIREYTVSELWRKNVIGGQPL